MKAYTDLEQSKKLAEILPIESADMWYCPYPNDVDWHNEPNIGKAELLLNQLPCWSLAALLELMPVFLRNEDEEFYLVVEKDVYTNGDIIYRVCYSNWDSLIKLYLEEAKTPIEAAYKMVVWLKENKKI